MTCLVITVHVISPYLGSLAKLLPPLILSFCIAWNRQESFPHCDPLLVSSPVTVMSPVALVGNKEKLQNGITYE